MDTNQKVIAANPAARLANQVMRSANFSLNASLGRHPIQPAAQGQISGLRAAGKPAKVAIVAIMRKLLTIVKALLRDNRKWTLKVA